MAAKVYVESDVEIDLTIITEAPQFAEYEYQDI